MFSPKTQEINCVSVTAFLSLLRFSSKKKTSVKTSTQLENSLLQFIGRLILPEMGNIDTKLNFRKAIIQLTNKNHPIDSSDDEFWQQFWSDHNTSSTDVFALIPANEIRKLRELMPQNLATLCYKAVERLVRAVESSCRTQQEQQCVLNCVRLLTRLIPFTFEDEEWRGFFWSSLPGNGADDATPLAQSLLNALCDLLFCPDFTVTGSHKNGPDKAEELSGIDSCEYIWEAGVGFAHSPSRTGQMESRRTEILKLVLTCFSETMYREPSCADELNKWIYYFTSAENRHALPLFTSLLNVICSYNPIGLGIPYNHLIFSDFSEPLVEVCLQILIVTLDNDVASSSHSTSLGEESLVGDNLFLNYLTRIHRDEDFQFIVKGITRLLNNPLAQNYLPNSTKRLYCHQELLVLFWKICDYNKKFLYYVLKSSDVLDVLVPILYYLNDSRADQSRVGLIHIGVFALLLLSGERNFGVRLNKPYTASVPMDIPVFTGSHADLLITVFHKIITTGHQRLQPLFDCLLTILVNVSPYLKTLSMVASVKLLHLLEAFSTPWFLYSGPSNHHLVFFLLEIFNNIIQYQFDGNSNLVYTLIRKRQVFHSLANLPTDSIGISKCLNIKRGERFSRLAQMGRLEERKKIETPPIKPTKDNEDSDQDDKSDSVTVEPSMEGSTPAKPAEPGTLNTTLLEIPDIGQMTESESAHPSVDQLLEPIDDTDSNIGNSVLKPSSSKTNSPVKEPARKIDVTQKGTIRMTQQNQSNVWQPSPEWAVSWQKKLPLQTIMRLLQVLVPQVEKICIDKGLTDESEILKFLQHGTLVGLLPVPHPILIRKYQANNGTTAWFRTYIWGVCYLRNVDPSIWYDTEVKLFEIQRV